MATNWWVQFKFHKKISHPLPFILCRSERGSGGVPVPPKSSAGGKWGWQQWQPGMAGVERDFRVSLVAFHWIKVNFCVLQTPDRAYGMGKVRLVWVLLRQNIPSTTVSPSRHSRENSSPHWIHEAPRDWLGKKWIKIFLKKSPWDHLLYLIRKSTFCAANKSWVSHEDLYHITHWNSMYNDTLVYTVVRIIIFVCLISLYFMPTTQHLILYSFRGRK